jgi:hypothetical protein
MQTTKDNSLVLGPTHSVFLYEPATGRVVHTHHQMTLKGATAPDRQELESDAVKAASRHHATAATLGALHIEGVNANIAYSVDVQKRALVELPLQTRG